jgi:hypothetical protein
MSLFDTDKINLEKCPRCSRMLSQTVGAARRSRSVRCTCGGSYPVDGRKFDRGLRQVEDAVDKLGRFGR